jgi:hypothetical protein
MEKTKKTTRKQSPKPAEEKIKAAYMNHLLTHGHRPASVYKFCLDLGISEDAFYSYAGSFEVIEAEIWKGFLDQTTAVLKADKAFTGFSAREQMLAFYYTLIEVLKKNRSYILLEFSLTRMPAVLPSSLSRFRSGFEAFVSETLDAGNVSGEVASRPGITARYPQLFWLHCGFILLFWRDDGSAGFERTDAAIEKSVNLAFDLIGKGAVDSTIDFARFIYQSRTN